MKDESITVAIARLRDRFGARAFCVVDHWDADPCAIGIAGPHEQDRLVYICTFGKALGRYDISLELPSTPGTDHPYTPAGDHTDLDFSELATIVARHLRLGISTEQANER